MSAPYVHGAFPKGNTINRTLPRSVLRLFTAFCLGFGLVLLPAALALAAPYTVNIPNGGYSSGPAYGNSADNGVNYDNASPDGNTLNINSGGAVDSAVGAYVMSSGAQSGSGNTVKVGSGGTVAAASGATIISNYDAATASGNFVQVEAGGAVSTSVIGGNAQANSFSGSGAAEASRNTVTIGGTVGAGGGIYGGNASDGFSAGATATASDNMVIINSGADVNSWIIGGVASANSSGGSAIAAGNRVIINGGAVNADVTGGMVLLGASVSAVNNTVTVKGGTFGPASMLKGGDLLTFSSGGDVFTGNTLNLQTSGLRVAGLANFEKLNFYLPTTLTANQTMLTVSGTADLTDGAGRSSIVNVGIDGASSPLQIGDQVILIDAATLTSNSGLNTAASGTGMQGVTLQYEFGISALNNQLLATVTRAGANEQSKALSEGFLSGLSLVSQGVDLIAGPGMSEAVQAARAAAAEGSIPSSYGLGSFAAVSGGWSRYNSGSHADMSSFSLLAGLSRGQDFTPGRLTLGAFAEYGNGAYDTYNSFSNAASVHGDGNVRHIGGGLLGRMDFSNTGPGNFYAQASIRAGGVHNEYRSSDLRDPMGRAAGYDSSSAYYGLHLGLGYVLNLSQAASLELYGKYFWTRQEGDSVRLSSGDPVSFEAADSQRLRLGGRLACAVNEYFSPYLGAAWEHEFDGSARAVSSGHAIDPPSLRGDTAMGEIGLSLKPLPTLPLSFDLGVQGYAGKREGVTGSLQVKLEF